MRSIYSYLFRAFYDWLRDNGANPRIMVDATKPGVVVPREYVSNGMILISIYHLYVSEFEIHPNKISFYTRFKGKKEQVVIPYSAMSELVCSDSGLSIPLSMWMQSIDVACHQFDTGVAEDSPDGDDDAMMDYLLNGDGDPNNKIIFSITADSGESSDSDDTEASESSDTQDADKHPKVKPNFTMLD